jgi:micrococcal nuclease
MLRGVLSFRVLLAVAILLLFHSSPPAASTVLREVTVTAVNDGDTITVLLNGKKTKTRLIGIDAPEMGQEPWGRKARGYLQKILKASDWRVSIEQDMEKQDKYKRLLAYVWLQNGAMANEQMLMDGYAFRFTMKPNTRYVDRLRKAQQNARSKKLGIWGPNGIQERPVDYKKSHPRK